MGALNVKKWSAAASVAESATAAAEDLMDCSMSHVGEEARRLKAAGKARGEREREERGVKLNGLAEVASSPSRIGAGTRCS